MIDVATVQSDAEAAQIYYKKEIFMNIINSITAIMTSCLLLISTSYAAYIDVAISRPTDSASSTNQTDGPTYSNSGGLWTPCDNRNDNENQNADTMTLSLTINNVKDPVTEQGSYDVYLIFTDPSGSKYIFTQELKLIEDSSNLFLDELYVSVPTIRIVDFDSSAANTFQAASGDLTVCKAFEASCTTFDGDKGYLEDNICYPSSSISSYLRCEDEDDEDVEPTGYLIKSTADLEQGDAFLAANDPIWEKSLTYTESFEEFFGDAVLAFDEFALPQGTWQIVAILAERSEFDIQDTSTWYKWDVENMLIGNPWGTDSCN